jgi:glycosyltransferase involved in cell wall biosynthesis
MNLRRDKPGGADFIVFSIGDSRKPSTWSNVPYYFTRTLEHRGFMVKHVDIGPARLMQLAFDIPWKAYCRLTGRDTRFTWLRSKYNRRVTDAKIRKALARWPEGHCVFMTYSFGAGPSRPYSLFCDQTFAQSIAYFDERTPDKLELPTVLAERKVLKAASLVIALFPEVAEGLRKLHGDKVKYYGNVVNTGSMTVDPQALIKKKLGMREVVFIGNRKYKEGLERLAEAVRVMNSRGMEGLVVNVVGMDHSDLRSPPRNMCFHGYLDKGKPDQARKYRQILERSRVYVNPNPKWAAFSASCEALFHCTPVVIYPYREFQRTFGDVNALGCALASSKPAELADAIAELLTNDTVWKTKALAAHEATKDMSWDNYVDCFLRDLGSERK